MSERRRRRGKGGGRGRRTGKGFMDAALDAYVRHLALEKWREVLDRQEALEESLHEAVQASGHFAGCGPYQDIWERWWQDEVVAVQEIEGTSLFGCIEVAIQGALKEEIGTRQERGDAPLEDGLAYKMFIDRAMNRLFAEEAGSLEEL
ncbi:MAG: hypothetical protein ETSY1_21335 [Candidatus Entotheonella factor]|uniref:Uncharacterized protein n=1 Tax=Entotheonella factor TaxID=1429438 RepID=W4LIR7_ENTF1|nr:MAG: hypothetical protein ETSY1_21335 [Candidatus Entotheonella factor]